MKADVKSICGFLFILLNLPLYSEGITTSTSSLTLSNGTRTEVVTYENEYLSLKVVPELGGKIISLLYKPLNREIALRSDRPYVPRENCGNSWYNTERDGIDEVFPYMAPVQYPYAPWTGIENPAHGELWRLKWSRIKREDATTLSFEARGKLYPFVFQRSISISQSTVSFHYRVENVGKAPLYHNYTWHNLFAAEKGIRFEVPPDTRVCLDWCNSTVMKPFGRTSAWKDFKDGAGNPYDLSEYHPDDKLGIKMFLGPFEDGSFTVHYPENLSMQLTWSEDVAPYIGFWISGNFKDTKCYAIEPTFAPSGNLDKLKKQGIENSIAPGKTISWSTELRFSRNAGR